MKRTKRIFILVMAGIFILAALTGCKLEETKEKKVKDLDYTVCDESKLPKELVELIHEKKKEPFKLTYRTKDYLYIVVGYGAQDRTDLNVVMTELYLTENAIFVDTDMTSVDSTTLEDNMVAYPWIAVKCELYDVQVNFR
ncbi:MAG: protease complex subunit PrcB family protein [Lachnospiraceae bacterium]|nr:protease complex subunit PrcB family protein [Lachnospiraceae bacterium]MDE6760076.1 protease complex subunit PrcB family protein [Lachnospiraceae bacterium]